MADPRLLALLERLERAAGRLEAQPVATAALAARHTALRQAMAEAVDGLDRLIAAEATDQ